MKGTSVMDRSREGFNFEEEYRKAKEQAPIRLPDPVQYNEFESTPVEKPKAIIENLLDSSSRMVFGGGSKTYKTWAMSDLALSIACGLPWWMFKCFRFPILYVNFELKAYYARERFRSIRLAKGIQKPPENLWIWNLRDCNVSNNLSGFRDQTVEFILRYAVAVIFLDPFYKLLGERDERISAELIPILNIFEDISKNTDTSTVTAAHYTKGNQASKDPLDRISGGAAINRHPDSMVLLTRHENDGSFTIDTITRDFAPLDKFVVSWEYPLLKSNSALDPEKIKVPKPGRPKEYDRNDILSVLKEHDDECSTTELFKVVHEEIGMGERCFYELLKELKISKEIFKSKLTAKWNCRI